MRDLVELKRASRDFTNTYVEAIFSKVRFDVKLGVIRANNEFKDAADISAAIAYSEIRESLEHLDDEIVWAYMTHLGVDTDFDEHFDRDD